MTQRRSVIPLLACVLLAATPQKVFCGSEICGERRPLTKCERLEIQVEVLESRLAGGKSHVNKLRKTVETLAKGRDPQDACRPLWDNSTSPPSCPSCPLCPPPPLLTCPFCPTNAPTGSPTSEAPTDSPTDSPTSVAPTTGSPTETPATPPTTSSPTSSPTSTAHTGNPTSLSPTTSASCQLVATSDFNISTTGLVPDINGNTNFGAHQTFGAWINGPVFACGYGYGGSDHPALRFGKAWHMASRCYESKNTLSQIVATVPQHAYSLEFLAIGGSWSTGADKVDVSLVDASNAVLSTSRFTTSGDVRRADGVWNVFSLDFTAVSTVTKLIFSTLEVGAAEGCITLANVTLTGRCPEGTSGWLTYGA